MLDMTSVVLAPCRLCPEVKQITVPVVGFLNWQAGKLIQDALPELDADERELLISGTCHECWTQLYPEED